MFCNEDYIRENTKKRKKHSRPSDCVFFFFLINLTQLKQKRYINTAQGSQQCTTKYTVYGTKGGRNKSEIHLYIYIKKMGKLKMYPLLQHVEKHGGKLKISSCKIKESNQFAYHNMFI